MKKFKDIKNTVSKCEKCVSSMWCMRLKPCKEYAPDISSLFLSEMELIKASNHLDLESANYVFR